MGAIATFTLLFQIFNLSRSITARWKDQWLVTVGVSHILFLFVLSAMMYLWAPHKYSQRYAYSQQIDGNEHDPGTNIPDSPVQSNSVSKTTPDVIGASAEEADAILEKI